MDIVFCVDRNVLPGLHVAGYSLLKHIQVEASIHLFSPSLVADDVTLFRETLMRTGKPFTLRLVRIDESRFKSYPTLHDGLAAYYRLLVPAALDVDRFLYLDADVLVDVDIGPLATMEMGDTPAAWTPEAPARDAVDREVGRRLSADGHQHYFNSGVILVNVAAWRRLEITEQALDYIAAHDVAFHDQSGLNWALRSKALALPERYNLIANKRTSWPHLRNRSDIGHIVHFVDSPKPWDLLGSLMHPQYTIWQTVYEKTALAGQSLHGRRAFWSDYRKSFKDRLLFTAYRRGWVRRVKGM